METIIESRIDGRFEGWKTGRVYKLANGQIWKQAQSKSRSCTRTRPKAKIWRDGARNYLEVEGMKEMVRVRRGSSDDL